MTYPLTREELAAHYAALVEQQDRHRAEARERLDRAEAECPFHSAGNTGRCRYCEDQ